MLLSSDRRRCRQSVQTRCSFLQGSRCRTPSEDRQSRHPSSLFWLSSYAFSLIAIPGGSPLAMESSKLGSSRVALHRSLDQSSA